MGRLAVRALRLAAVLACVVLVTSGCPLTGKPDLVVTSLTLLGEPGPGTTEGEVQAAIEVVVENKGLGYADIFKVAVEYTSAAGTFTVPFKVEGQTDPWYPYTNEGLVPGESVTFTGVVTFGVMAVGVDLRAIADSCVGDNITEPYCRVNESDETNNVSADWYTFLPLFIWP